jgi:phosphoglucomutase/phosphopentomutase
MTSMYALAEEYVQWDPNPETRHAMQALIDAKEENELIRLVSKRIQFGTAGLRAAMGPGYVCMNDLVVLQTCQGLIRYLESVDPSAKEKVLICLVSFTCL